MHTRKEGDFFETDEPQVGRRTIKDDWLSANRDAILNIFFAWWPAIGWELEQAKSREELRRALDPVKDHPNRQYLHRLLRPTNVSATAPEIRQKRRALGQSVKARHTVQAKHDDYVRECQELELAIGQATPEQIDIIRRELSHRKAELQKAQEHLKNANENERAIEEELLDKEAAFAQDELLDFIKGKYACDPLNLANAMAGLPYGFDVPFLGVWQSHARCAKLDSPALPSFHYLAFQAIESIWERSRDSAIPLFEFFQQEIKALPKTIVMKHPVMGEQRTDNYARTHLCEHWWYLQRAIEQSIEAENDPRPMHFRIAARFDQLLAKPRTNADSAVAKTARIQC